MVPECDAERGADHGQLRHAEPERRSRDLHGADGALRLERDVVALAERVEHPEIEPRVVRRQDPPRQERPYLRPDLAKRRLVLDVFGLDAVQIAEYGVVGLGDDEPALRRGDAARLDGDESQRAGPPAP